MAIDFADALRATQDLLQDHAGLLADPAVLGAWLDQGQQDVAALTLCYQRVLTLTSTDSPQALSAGQRTYPVTLPVGSGGLGLPDYLSLLHVLLNGVPLFLWTPNMAGIADVRGTDGGGTPRYYYEFAKALSFLPYPNAAFVASTWALELTYGASPPVWTSGASVLPATCDECPIYFAATRIAIQRKHWPQAAEWHQMYWSQVLAYRLSSGLVYATPQSQRQQPVDVEREDEPRRLRVVAQARAQARQGRRGG